MAYPPSQVPAGATDAPPPSTAGPMAPVAPQPQYTTPSGIPALPRPQLQLSSEDVKLWWGRVTQDRARRKLEEPKWRLLLNAYYPPKYGSDYTDLNSNIHFRNVCLKSSEIWGQFPDLVLTPLGPLRGIPQLDPNGQPMPDPKNPQQPLMASPDDIVAIKRAFLNKDLGRDGANVDAMIRACQFDMYQTAGVGPSKICYESDVKYIEPTPSVVPGAILGLSQPTPQQPVVVNERRRWYHFSAEQLLIPAGFLSTDYDRASYLGMEFEELFTENSKRAYNLPDDFTPTAATVDKPLSADADRAAQNSQKVIKGIEIWLHGADFDPNEADRDVFYRLVLIDGIKDRAAVYELSPYQDKGMDGRLTADSMIGNPIHPFTPRTMTGTAWPPSDAAFTNPLVNIENAQEKTDALLREANIPRFAAAVSLSAALDKARDASVGQGVFIDDAIMARGQQNLMWPFPHLERAQSDIQGREHIRQANTETLGLGANQGGAYNQVRKTATETAVVAQSVSARLQGERLSFLSDFMRGVRKYDALVMRYETAQGYVQLVGADGQRKLAAYTNAHISGRFAYDAHPDSQLTEDQATRIRRMTDFVNFLAKSPSIDQTGLARIATTEFGYNAAELVHPPPPPPPDKPNVTYSFKGEDLAIPEVRSVLGLFYPQLAAVFNGPVSPEAIAAYQAAQAKAQPHAGSQPKAEKVNEHAASETGNQVGTPPLAGHPAQTPEHLLPQMAH